jgi:putative ABC transport system substrate-binding protein
MERRVGLSRRKAVALMGGAAMAWPAAASAEQRIPRIGVLVPANPDTFRIPFEQGLVKLGYVPGQNILVDFRSADGHPDRLPLLAAELVRRKVDLLVAFQTPAAHAAKNATREIPIVISAGDPLGTGLVDSLARPGGNVTGYSSTTAELGVKTVDLLRELLPALRRVAVLANAADPFTPSFLRHLEAGGKPSGVEIRPLLVRGAEEFGTAFGEFERWRAEAVIVQPSLPRGPALELVRKHRLLSVSPIRAFAAEGGLMSFAANFTLLYADTATYVDKILKGSKPGDLPVQQPTRFELVINLKSAKALGLAVPAGLLARADEVIE